MKPVTHLSVRMTAYVEVVTVLFVVRYWKFEFNIIMLNKNKLESCMCDCLWVRTGMCTHCTYVCDVFIWTSDNLIPMNDAFGRNWSYLFHSDELTCSIQMCCTRYRGKLFQASLCFFKIHPCFLVAKWFYEFVILENSLKTFYVQKIITCI